jgi:protein-L-isoaspartate(D-aspartate) O-methyltransferase
MLFDWRSDDEDEGQRDFAQQREQMVDRLSGRIDHSSTEAAMRAVPRHEFVPDARQDAAYEDRPLPIGHQQTISAPHMVAIMVDMLALEQGKTVLEIGTGCGYHAAVMAEVVGASNVFSVEYVETLAKKARRRLTDLGYGDISIRCGDGHDGWPDHAPYDAAYLTCAAGSIPHAVIEQVSVGGAVLAPLGRGHQRLIHGEKQADGTLDRKEHGGVRFVPMQGGS